MVFLRVFLTLIRTGQPGIVPFAFRTLLRKIGQSGVNTIWANRRRDLESESTRAPAESILSDSLVSIIIPTRDGGRILENCVESIILNCRKGSYEIVIVDNGSRDPSTLQYLMDLPSDSVRVLTIDEPFNFSRLNNQAAAASNGDYLCLLNDDTVITTGGFLEKMVDYAGQKDVGAVGALLLYPSGKVQHAGVYLWGDGLAFHLASNSSKESLVHYGIPPTPHEVMAVTGACIMVQKAKYMAAGGLNEDLAVGLNDVDFCLRLRSLGLKNIIRPDVEVIHHESLSRGKIFTRVTLLRAIGESFLFLKRWSEIYPEDVFLEKRICFSRAPSIKSLRG